MEGLDDGTPIFVSPYPAAWRVEVVDEDKHRGFEYIRFHWGSEKRAWDMSRSSPGKVQFWEDGGNPDYTWKLIPVKVEGTSAPPQPSSETLGSDSLPSYDSGAPGHSSTHTQRESEQDEFGTVVNEVTVVTTTSTVTTRKRYRVEDA